MLVCVLERRRTLRASQAARVGLTKLIGETHGGDPEARSAMFILITTSTSCSPARYGLGERARTWQRGLRVVPNNSALAARTWKPDTSTTQREAGRSLVEHFKSSPSSYSSSAPLLPPPPLPLRLLLPPPPLPLRLLLLPLPLLPPPHCYYILLHLKKKQLLKVKVNFAWLKGKLTFLSKM